MLEGLKPKDVDADTEEEPVADMFLKKFVEDVKDKAENVVDKAKNFGKGLIDRIKQAKWKKKVVEKLKALKESGKL